ncbi:MAG: 2-oxo acid dehydrogenase subunit E2 [Chloroflexi bacterium]|nr:MAG: 2-oxo acid dehydrogenase subunit E2 [Chloroflexota bacterium]
MAKDFFIPKLGQTGEEVTITGWLVKDGAKVEQGQAVIEVETDKAVFPVEANASGYIHLGPYKEGDVVPVVTTVAIIGEPNDQFVMPDTSAPPAAQAEPVKAAAPAPTAEPPGDGQSAAGTEESGKIFVSPRAKKLAEEKKVDLRRVTPTGGEGARIREQDVRNYLSRTPKASPLAQKVAGETGLALDTLSGTGPAGRIMRSDVQRALQETGAPAAATAPQTAEDDVLERTPLSGVRGIIAERMSMSVHTTARVTLVAEADATEFAAMRQRLKERTEKEWGFAVGYNDLLAKITASALRKFPYMNARITQDAIETLKPVNMGMAVDTERGLLVPVIRNADQKSLRQFGQEFRDMVERARSRKSMPDDLAGGTFTITSLGAFGIDAFTPVINLPEAAILGVGRIAPKVVPFNGQPAIRTVVTLSLVFDHRLVDGAPAARFLSYIRELIEEPYLLISELQD